MAQELRFELRSLLLERRMLDHCTIPAYVWIQNPIPKVGLEPTQISVFETDPFTNLGTSAFMKYSNLSRVKELNHLQYFRGSYKTVQFYTHLPTASSGMPDTGLEPAKPCF
jgi:hypothetical protein